MPRKPQTAAGRALQAASTRRADLAVRRRTQKAAAEPRWCAQCGSELEPLSRRDAKYCSGACRIRASRIRRGLE